MVLLISLVAFFRRFSVPFSPSLPLSFLLTQVTAYYVPCCAPCFFHVIRDCSTFGAPELPLWQKQRCSVTVLVPFNFSQLPGGYVAPRDWFWLVNREKQWSVSLGGWGHKHLQLYRGVPWTVCVSYGGECSISLGPWMIMWSRGSSSALAWAPEPGYVG